MALSVLRRPAPWPDSFDSDLRRAFASPGESNEAPYRLAFRYLVTSFCQRKTPGGAGARQPGARSTHGSRVDEMEGFSRLAPLFASWVAGGRGRRVEDLYGRKVDVLQLLVDGLLAGTDPGTDSYWGNITPFDQRIVEAADIARALWIGRGHLAAELNQSQLTQIASWLLQENVWAVYENNWLLFPVLVNETLRALGMPSDAQRAADLFARFLRLYRGEGWFIDGEDGHVDWYNAWGIHYELFWLREISSRYRTPELDDTVRQFAATMPYLIGPDGIPIMGRSVSYRLAAPAPLVASCVATAPVPGETPGLARRALDAVWRYFIARGAFEAGRITQGYCRADLRLLDNYSGPSSPLWGARPLVLAFLAPPEHPFWTAPATPLPVEEAGFARKIPSIGWELLGDSETSDIRILLNGARADTPPVTGAVRPFSLPARLVGGLAGVFGRSPLRPANWSAKYDLPVYSSRYPFCGCSSR